MQEPICHKCGQAVNRIKDSFRQVGGSVEHVSCPVSAEIKNLPAQGVRDTAREAAGRQQFQQFLTIGQVAKMLSVSDQTIVRRIRSGALPARRLAGGSLGGREVILIDQADVLALLEPYTGVRDTGREEVAA